MLLPAQCLQAWTPGKEGTPKLYVLQTRLYSRRGNLLAEKTERFGYRSIEVLGPDVLLNGQKIIFRADNIAFVRALTRWADGLFDEVWLRKFIRAAVQDYNLNYVRVHLGHANTLFYDIADEEGLMIQDEWGFMHEEEPEGQALEDTREEMSRWIIQNENHPAIVAWDQENEGNVRIPSLIEEFRALDPTRIWSEQDFVAKHVYDYSEQVVRDFDPSVIPREKPYTVLESCRFWTNEFGELELREDYKTTRCASGWGLFYYDKEDIARLLADLHSDIGTFYRSQRIQAWSPFALLSGSKNGHNYFKGNIIDSLVPQPNLVQLARLNEPVGASIKMNQAREWYKDRTQYAPGQTYRLNAIVWNDFSERADVVLTLTLKNEAGKAYASVQMPVTVDAYKSKDAIVPICMPRDPGVYYVDTELTLADGKRVQGVQRRFMVGTNPRTDEYMAFGGRSIRQAGMRSVMENFVRDSLPKTAEKTIQALSEDCLIDRLNKTEEGGFLLQTTHYESPVHFRIMNYEVSGDGMVLSQELTEGRPYYSLPDDVKEAIRRAIGLVPEAEANVSLTQKNNAWQCELKPEGSKKKVKVIINSTITL